MSEGKLYSRTAYNGYRVFNNLNNSAKATLIQSLLSACTLPSGESPNIGKHLAVELPNSSLQIRNYPSSLKDLRCRDTLMLRHSRLLKAHGTQLSLLRNRLDQRPRNHYRLGHSASTKSFEISWIVRTILFLALPSSSQKIVDQYFWVNLFLYVTAEESKLLDRNHPVGLYHAKQAVDQGHALRRS